MLKRLIDLAASAFGLLLLSPALLAVAVWVKCDSSGPVFYLGRRAGRLGRVFAMLKFRSMVANADKIGGPSTSGDDMRVTTSGRWLRRLKLDELPQLINVIRGDMSLVGPRPEVVCKTEKYDAIEREVLSVRPGITDWASLWNCDEGAALAGAPDADAAYEAVIRPYKMKLQLYYVDNRSVFSDFKIIVFTVVRIFAPTVTPREISEYPSLAELQAEVAQYVAADRRASAA